MGFEQLRLKDFHFNDFSAGWYPNKNRNEIPTNFYTGDGGGQPGPTGFSDCQHIIWYQGHLRKWFGYDVINARVNSGANGNGMGNAVWPSENSQFAVFGSIFYENLAGTWTDRSTAAAITLTDDTPCVFKTHIQGSNRYVIGGNGTDDMFKWTGTGNNIAALSGSPHKFISFDNYGERWWGVKANDNTVYGSDLTNPQSNWNNSGIIYSFKGTVYGVQSVNTWLAVVQRKRIGAIRGFGPSSLSKDDSVLQIGSTSPRTFAAGKIQGERNGFYLVGEDGPYFIAEDLSSIPLGGQHILDWWNEEGNVNKTYMHRAVGCWADFYNYYIFAIPTGLNQWPNSVFVYDATRNSLWPMPDILTSSYGVRYISAMQDSNNKTWIYLQDDNGWVYKFDPAEKNYHPNNAETGIDAYGQTGVFDLRGFYDLREPQLYAKTAGDWSLRLYLNFDSEIGSGNYGDVPLNVDADVLGSFVLGASTLGGRTYVLDDAEVAGNGELLQMKIANDNVDENFELEEIVLWMKFIRQRSYR